MSKVKVCDAIMSAGKSSAAIAYMNANSHRKFIYITPYLDEAARIKEGCPDLHFVEPSDKLRQYGYRKVEHTAHLITEGRNVATTHQAFKGYTKETLESITRNHYSLIIDENVDVLEEFQYHPGDLKLAMDAGCIKQEGDSFLLGDNPYEGVALREVFSLLKSRELLKLPVGGGETLFFWALPPDLITAFDEVIIMTYLFQGQSLHHFLKMYDIPYEYIGVRKTESGYEFTDKPQPPPDYVRDIGSRLHILDLPKLNEIGDGYYDLSMTWYEKTEDGATKVKNNMYNCMRHIWKDIPAERKMWGAYNGQFAKLKGKGYAKSFLTFNAKATNKYRDRDSLVYVVNTFMKVSEKTFYESRGIEVDEDMFALSVMIQWIWRSAIREGRETQLYIPSKRMRDLLIRWMNDISNGVSYGEWASQAADEHNR